MIIYRQVIMIILQFTVQHSFCPRTIKSSRHNETNMVTKDNFFVAMPSRKKKRCDYTLLKNFIVLLQQHQQHEVNLSTLVRAQPEGSFGSTCFLLYMQRIPSRARAFGQLYLLYCAPSLRQQLCQIHFVNNKLVK